MLKYLAVGTCNVCGKQVTAEALPETWETSSVGEDVHFCSSECKAKAVKRIEDAYTMVFGRVLTNDELDTLRDLPVAVPVKRKGLFSKF